MDDINKPGLTGFLTLATAVLVLNAPASANEANMLTAGHDQLPQAINGSPWVLKAQIDFKLGYSDNIDFMNSDNEVPDFFISGARTEYNKGSSFSSVKPTFTLTKRDNPKFNVFALYAADIQSVHEKHDNDRVWHWGMVGFDGKKGNVRWDVFSANLYVDGNDEPNVFNNASVTTAGNLPLAFSRSAFYSQNRLSVTFQYDNWFVRPRAYYRLDDFNTKSRDVFPILPTALAPPHLGSTPVFAQNLIDREEYNGGIDVGFRIMANTDLVFGFRYGVQRQDENKNPINTAVADQYDAAGFPFNLFSPAFRAQFSGAKSSNSYRRYTVGLEGSPTDWMDINLHVGVDRKHYEKLSQTTVPAVNGTFDLKQTIPYATGRLDFQPSLDDEVWVKVDWYGYMAFAGFRAYEDISFETQWKHHFNEKWSSIAYYRLWDQVFDEDQLDRHDRLNYFRLGGEYAFNNKMLFTAYVEHVNGHDTRSKGKDLTKAQQNNFVVGLNYKFN